MAFLLTLTEVYGNCAVSIVSHRNSVLRVILPVDDEERVHCAGGYMSNMESILHA